MGCHRACRPFREHKRALILLLTPILLLAILPYYEVFGLTQRACNCLYMLLLMAVYWCTEALPLAVTALLPLVLAPMMGILESSAVCKNYFKDKIALIFGSMILAHSIQHSGLHRRIALTFIKLMGTRPKFLMLGFMIPTWLLSMWISNTVTTVMMVSILNCVIRKLKEETPEEMLQKPTGAKQSNGNDIEMRDVEAEPCLGKRAVPKKNNFEALAKCLSLAVCYSATAGGIATLTGTGTNIILYDNTVQFGEKLDYDFGVNLPRWMLFALPVSILMLVVMWIWLQILFMGCRKSLNQSAEEREKIAEVIASEYSSLGLISWEEAVTLAHLIVLVLLWLTRNPGRAGGWSDLFEKGFVTDTTAAMIVALSLLLMPKYPPLIFKLKNSRPHEPLLSWKEASQNLSWTALFLLAGGLALADCVDKSGLSAFMGSGLSSLSDLPLWLMVMILCLITAGVTEFSSNIVIAAIFIPILGDLAIQMQIHPLSLMIPCAVAASFAFMLPVATPPNAIVYTNGILRIKDMMIAGAVMNLVGIAMIMLATFTWLPAVFNFSDFSYSNTTAMSMETVTSLATNITTQS